MMKSLFKVRDVSDRHHFIAISVDQYGPPVVLNEDVLKRLGAIIRNNLSCPRLLNESPILGVEYLGNVWTENET